MSPPPPRPTNDATENPCSVLFCTVGRVSFSFSPVKMGKTNLSGKTKKTFWLFRLNKHVWRHTFFTGCFIIQSIRQILFCFMLFFFFFFVDRIPRPTSSSLFCCPCHSWQSPMNYPCVPINTNSSFIKHRNFRCLSLPYLYFACTRRLDT